MKSYILIAYFEANPIFKSTTMYTWEEAVREFGSESAQFNWGKDGENCPNKAEGLECHPWKDGTIREDLVQEFIVIDNLNLTSQKSISKPNERSTKMANKGTTFKFLAQGTFDIENGFKKELDGNGETVAFVDPLGRTIRLAIALEVEDSDGFEHLVTKESCIRQLGFRNLSYMDLNFSVK